jgi:flagellar biosynthetic protein FlhB
MAQNDSGRTEPPTAKKRRDSYEKGDIPRSADIAAWAAVLAGLFVVPFALRILADMVAEGFAVAADLPADANPETVLKVAGQLVWPTATSIGVVAIVCSFVAFSATAGQVGLRFTPKAAAPKLKNLNPINGFKRLFSLRSVVELIKQLTKTAVIIAVIWPRARDLTADLVTSGRQPLGAGLRMAGASMLGAARTITIAMLLIAFADYAWQRREWLKRNRMTKQEVKDEMKQTEGDPLVKMRLRSLARALARSRMIADVPSATVVVTNPTHYAVALRYEPGKSAPRVVAKGVDAVAAKIRDAATAHDIPMVAAPPLARALHRSCEIGDEIPMELFRAVGAVIAFITQTSIRAAAIQELPETWQVPVVPEELPTAKRRRQDARRARKEARQKLNAPGS